ncbi:hypothetical protein N0V86_007807 [Didymella sp. IMI 355093]|nr:hypothetical protein N0V86_007807 [Didymella sp. IMI 355093]
MFRVPSDPNGLESDTGTYAYAYSASPVRTPATIGVSSGAHSPRSRLANGWEHYMATISRADIRDRRTACDERRAAGRRLKQRWSAVKLMSSAEYVREEQAQASGHTAVNKLLNRLRTLSPASQGVMPQQREVQSVGTQNAVLRELVRSQSPNSAVAQPAALDEDAEQALEFSKDINGDLTRAEIERHSEWNHAAKRSREFEPKGARVHIASVNSLNVEAATSHGLPVYVSDSVPATTADTRVIPSSAIQEQQETQIVKGSMRTLSSREAKIIAAAGIEQANANTSTDILHVSNPSVQFTKLFNPHVHHSAHRRQRTVRQECIFLDEQDLDNGMFVSTPTVRSRVNLKDPNVDLTEIGAVFPHPEPLGAALTGSYADDFPGISTQSQFPVQRYRARVDSLSTHASDDATVHMFGHRSDISEHSEQWMIRDFDDSKEVVRSHISTPVRYTPTSGSDGDCVSNVSANEASLVLRKILESTIEEEHTTKFLTLPRGPVSSDSDTPKQSLDQALQVLELDRYISVDMDKLLSCLQAKLLRCHSPAKLAKAFAAVVEHQDETDRWAPCLRWDNGSD